MTTKNKFIVGLISLLAAFLVGFVPQYLQKARFQGQLHATSERVKFLEVEMSLSDLRDLSGMMLLDVLHQNYGLTRDHASQYFEKLSQAVQATDDSSRKQDLQELLNKRDGITAILAQGDAASVPQVEELFARTQELARHR